MIFKNFPKLRPPLTRAHIEIYEREYILNRDGGASLEGLAKKLEAWMHKSIANADGTIDGPILEVGAGTLNHFQYESKVSAHYDVVEPSQFLYEGRPETEKVASFYYSIKDTPENTDYKRILSVAVLEHMTDLPYEVAQCGIRLDGKDGLFQVGIPSEGGFLWGLAWRATTGISYWLRNRISYKTVMQHEHVNDAKEIIQVISQFFECVKVKRFPTPFHHLSFYAYIEASSPRKDKCKEFLVQRNDR